MKKQILNEVIQNGIFLNSQLLDETEKKSLRKDFEFKKDHEIFKINEEKEIKEISEVLFNFLQRDYIKDFLHEYYGKKICKCTNILFTRSKPELKRNDDEYITDGSVLGFHNDDSGKQIKINILLNDLSEKSNGLEYAISSHKISFFDQCIISFLKIFGLFKNWNKHFLNYQKNKFQKKKVNFMTEKEIKKKFEIIKVHGKCGLVYIFDTNGYHRQGSVESENFKDTQRELITIYYN